MDTSVFRFASILRRISSDFARVNSLSIFVFAERRSECAGEQERMAEAAMAKVAARSKRAQAVTDAQKSSDDVENAREFRPLGGAPYGSRTRLFRLKI